MGMSEESLWHLRQFVIDEVGKLAQAELRRLAVMLVDGTIIRLAAERPASGGASKGQTEETHGSPPPVQGDDVVPFRRH
jgi:hypothetical protein